MAWEGHLSELLVQDELRAKGQAPEFERALDVLCVSVSDAIAQAEKMISFRWAKFSARDKPVTGMEVVLCMPEKADAEITNAGQLVGKMAAVYRGACSFQEQTERLMAAGAHGVIIINTEKARFEDPAADAGFSANIPVVMIKAKDVHAVLASGDSSSLVLADNCREAMVRGGVLEVLLKCAEDAVSGGQWKRASKAISCARNVAMGDPVPLTMEKSEGVETFEIELSWNNTESASRLPEHIPALLRLARAGGQSSGEEAETTRLQALRIIAGRPPATASIAEALWSGGWGEQIVVLFAEVVSGGGKGWGGAPAQLTALDGLAIMAFNGNPFFRATWIEAWRTTALKEKVVETLVRTAPTLVCTRAHASV